jgi:hypothetical protein
VKVLLASAIVVAAMFAIVTSCSINHRSDQFACTKPSDCSDGRECINGECVVPGGVIDAAMTIDVKVVDANQCPDGCTSCDLGHMVCTIDCATGGNCDRPVTCPAGWNCVIKCTVNDECRSGIDCSAAKSCSLTCSGSRSCESVTCGMGKCSATCTGMGSCRDVDCTQSCACDVTCSNNIGACLNPGPMCPAGTFPGACDNGLGCTSQGIGCSSCM